MEVTTCLRDGALRELFIEHLGWDRIQGALTIRIGQEAIVLERIAHKRGFLVVQHVTDRARAQTRRHIRTIQAQMKRLSEEHLLVVMDERSRVQVWAWAFRDARNGRLRHRLHPFFSERIPEAMVARVKRLAVSLGEEEQLTLFDVSHRVRGALDAEQSPPAFFRRPGYAQRSHELAVKMRRGGIEETNEFICFHQRLATWFARKYRHQAEDQEDMAQEAMVGLIRAAHRFDPARGTAFSTYAYVAMRQQCRCCLPNLVRLGRVPDYLYWRFRRIMWRWEKATMIGGPDAGLDARDEAIRQEGIGKSAFVDVYRMSQATSAQGQFGAAWSDCMGSTAYTHDLDGSGRIRHPLVELIRAEQCEHLQAAFRWLSEGDAQIVRSRFGIGNREMTLQEVGDDLKLTRERVRQREYRAIRKLRDWFEKRGLLPASASIDKG